MAHCCGCGADVGGLPVLKVLSLFAGIGGFDLGLERTGGFRTIAVAEVDEYASSVLKIRFPDAINIGDVTTAEFPNADIICAGFPCQDISFAGNGAGLAGKRSGLFWEVVRAIRMVRPGFVVLENVAALLSRGLDVVLWALAEVGYDTEWHCIPASAVGAPHRRDRIWIIAHPRSEQHEGSCPPFSGTLAARLLEALAHPESDGQPERGTGHEVGDAETAGGFQFRTELGGGGASSGEEPLADASCIDVERIKPRIVDQEERAGSNQRQAGSCCDVNGWWSVEPDVGRVANGIPKRVDRLRCLGNAVVPQIPELIGHAILEAIARQEAA